MRFFNTSGPVVAADHYLVQPLDRLDFDEFRGLVRDKRYFVMHAPRQSGKTSVLLAARELLGREGYSCVYASFEVARALEDNEQAVRAVLAQLGSRALRLGDDFVDGAWPDLLDKYGPETALGELLSRWAAAPRPLVLLVRRVVEPIISGGENPTFTNRDLEYARDLGLVAPDEPLRIANPIYAEVIRCES